MKLKKLLPAVACTLLMQAPAFAIEISPHLSGSWYNADQSGHGFSIEIASDELTVLYWYVYNPDGTPTFLIGVGQNKTGGRIDLTFYHNTGMRWGVWDPSERAETEWGYGWIDFLDCNHATLGYQSWDLQQQPIPYGFGSVDLVRLVSIADSKCAENRIAGIYQGWLSSEAQDDENPAIALLAIDGSLIIKSEDHLAVDGGIGQSSGAVYPAGRAWSVRTGEPYYLSFDAIGQLVPDYRLALNYQVGDDRGFADFYPVTHLYWRGATLKGLAGEYRTDDSSDLTTITAGGAISGSDSEGCSWSGQISIPDERYNLFDITYTATGCGDIDGTYYGMGFTTDGMALEDNQAIVLIAFSEDQYSEVYMIRDDGG